MVTDFHSNSQACPVVSMRRGKRFNLFTKIPDSVTAQVISFISLRARAALMSASCTTRILTLRFLKQECVDDLVLLREQERRIINAPDPDSASKSRPVGRLDLKMVEAALYPSRAAIARCTELEWTSLKFGLGNNKSSVILRVLCGLSIVLVGWTTGDDREVFTRMHTCACTLRHALITWLYMYHCILGPLRTYMYVRLQACSHICRHDVD